MPTELDPVNPEEELLADLKEAIKAIKIFLYAKEYRLEDIFEKTGFDRNKTIIDAKEIVNKNNETRKYFGIICREVFKKFKACLTVKVVNNYYGTYDAINIIYKNLKYDVEKADISSIIRKLHAIIEDSIESTSNFKEPNKLYDVSKIDFEQLRKEF